MKRVYCSEEQKEEKKELYSFNSILKENIPEGVYKSDMPFWRETRCVLIREGGYRSALLVGPRTIVPVYHSSNKDWYLTHEVFCCSFKRD